MSLTDVRWHTVTSPGLIFPFVANSISPRFRMCVEALPRGGVFCSLSSSALAFVACGIVLGSPWATRAPQQVRIENEYGRKRASRLNHDCMLKLPEPR